MNRVMRYSLTLVKEGTTSYTFEKPVTNQSIAYDIAKSLQLDMKAEEEFWIICLDTKNKPNGLHLVSQGSLNSSVVHPREVFKRAILNNACSIICMHNHPSGVPEPSQTDIDITRRLTEGGVLIGITVLDHIIVGEGQYRSLKEMMLM